jgi:YggT family protein
VVLRVVLDVLQVYLYVVLARVILSWFPIGQSSRLYPLVRVLGRLTDPVLVPVRRLLPPLRVGGMGVDFSPIVVVVALEVLISVLR